ncbi:O83 family O-antigen flippase [Desulfomicrobium salsuginis]
MQLVSIFTLARILPTEDFGLMALAATVTAFAGLMRDMGTGAAIIQKQDLSFDLINAVFLFNVLLGIITTVILIAVSSLVSIFFKEPRLIDILFVLAPVFTITSLGTVHQSLLERDSLFKHIAKIELTSGLCGLIFAIVVAWQGGGVYALVVQSIVTASVSTIFLWIVSDWRPVFKFKFMALKEIFGFSCNIFLFNFVNYFHRNSDSMLIGKFLGVVDLGFYNVAYRILLFPVQNITFVINRAMFPAYSRKQNSRSLIEKHYMETLETIAFITAPLMALIWALREPLVSVFLGDRWLPAADVIAWLAPVGFFQSMVSTSGSVLNSIGRSDVLRNLGLIGVPFLTASFVVGLPWGIEGVAAAYCIASFFWIYPVIKTVLKLLCGSFLEFVFVIFKPTFLSIFVALFVCYFIRNIMTKNDLHLAHLFAGIFIGLVSYLILSLFFMRKTVIRIFFTFQKNCNEVFSSVNKYICKILVNLI